MITQRYKLNLIPEKNNVAVLASQYDKGLRTIVFEIYNGAQQFSIPQGSIVSVIGTKKDWTGFQYECTYEGSEVSFVIEDQITIFAGEVPAEIRIQDENENIIGTANFIFNIEQSPLADDIAVSETELELIEQAARAVSSIETATETMGQLENAIEDANEILGNLDPVIEQIEDYAEDSEAWAVGTRSGQNVPASDITYNNNSKYYAQYAEDQADKAEQAANISGFMEFHIDGNGDLIYTKTDLVDVDFKLIDGDLIMEVAG